MGKATNITVNAPMIWERNLTRSVSIKERGTGFS